MPSGAARHVPERSPGRLPRGTLDPGVIVEAAFAFAEEHGVEAITVPALAERLGVRTTAIYWHFRRKDDLIAALSAAAVERFNALFPPPSVGSWQQQARSYWSEYRRIVRQNPVLFEFMVARWDIAVASAEAVRRHHDRIDRAMAPLLAAGMSPDRAARAYYVLSTFVHGSLSNERNGRRALHRASAGHGDPAPGPTDGLPALAATWPYWNWPQTSDADFDAGLATILAGLGAELDMPRERG
ncbi:MAG TPA: TetR/AcrR family transcriptional regulator [Mycobacteriales bacterium]|jgi:AcrR family transcriptional regulator|nr:TetR/AcrR family transcriptional regulator [Mycobacteriales bacterium]